MELNGHSPAQSAALETLVALAGNPNVGKSTVFNALTGARQHTGNWAGKTVGSASGVCTTARRRYTLLDIPGTYSLLAHSEEEAVARDALCFDKADGVIVICDATCLSRNLNLALQIMEITSNVVICINLMDEAKRKGISINTHLLSERLGVPVIGISAHRRADVRKVMGAVDALFDQPQPPQGLRVRYPLSVEHAVAMVDCALCAEGIVVPDARWLSLRLLEGDESLLLSMRSHLGFDPSENRAVSNALQEAREFLRRGGMDAEQYRDAVVTSLVRTAESVCRGAVTYARGSGDAQDRRIDRFLTGRFTGFAAMLSLLGIVFYLTLIGANYPSQLLQKLLFSWEAPLDALLASVGLKAALRCALVSGAYRVLAWVVSVMLPPMAIFFPLFTLLEDVGYLPRVAYNLDKPFQRCRACGKQALTMCMGFGCNAAGVVGCRIIDSPRERLLAILSNSFVPCNGRLPLLSAVITMFLLSGGTSPLLSAGAMTALILLSVCMTLAATRLLSSVFLRGEASSFTLELPPYRTPQLGTILVRSLLDRTVFVLGRAAAVAAPMGLFIWMLAHMDIHGISLLQHCARFLDPLGQWMGLDGVILLAFILGFPANEIVLPIAVMIYTMQGALLPLGGTGALRAVLIENGWTLGTAVSMLLFSLMHWPCSTTMLTIHRESGKVKWTLLAFALPTAFGIAACMAWNALYHLL